EAVAGGAVIAENHVAALLAAEVETIAQHFVDDVFVAHRRANDFAAGLGDDGFQSGVAHDGGDDGFVAERSLREHLQAGNGHDVIAIDHRAGFVAQEDAVGVAVVCDADAGVVLADFPAHLLGMHGTAVLVDVHAVGLIAVNNHFRAEFAQDAGRGFVSGAVRAIHHQAHAFEGHAAREGGFGVFDVTAEGVVDTHGFADGFGGWADGFDFAAENEVLNLVFNFVVELVTVRAEKFNSVVGVGIVRGGDDDAGIGAEAAGDISHAGSWERSDEQHVHAHGENAGGNGVFEHVTREPRVLAENNFVAAASAGLGFEIFKNVPGGAAEFQCSFRCDGFNIRNATDTVRTEDLPGCVHWVLGGAGRTSTTSRESRVYEMPWGRIILTSRTPSADSALGMSTCAWTSSSARLFNNLGSPCNVICTSGGCTTKALGSAAGTWTGMTITISSDECPKMAEEKEPPPRMLSFTVIQIKTASAKANSFSQKSFTTKLRTKRIIWPVGW